ncbi:hypothetical protein C8J56DRAFT_913831 [Mycena floridula]|nr:hypothetical protein C8J56DRAFT_913831 [Mycena floridula]
MEPDMIVTVSAEREPTSPYIDALASEEAAIEAETANDSDEIPREVINTAVRFYNRRLFFTDAFPTSKSDEDALQALTSVLQFYAEKPPGAHLELLRRRGRVVLEHWKNELRPLVVDKYHLDPQADQESQSAMIRSLLHNSTFLQKDGLIFRAPIIEDAFGILHQNLRLQSPYPENVPPTEPNCEAIALVAIALECCLDEWKSGKRVDLAFKAEAYETRYKEHLTNLIPLANATGNWNFERETPL